LTTDYNNVMHLLTTAQKAARDDNRIRN